MKKDANSVFNELQNEYLKTKSKKILGDMYLLILKVCKNGIGNYCEKRHFKFSYDDFEEKSEIAAIFIIERYLKNPNFKIDKLSSYCHFALLKGLFSSYEIDKNETRLDDCYNISF